MQRSTAKGVGGPFLHLLLNKEEGFDLLGLGVSGVVNLTLFRGLAICGEVFSCASNLKGLVGLIVLIGVLILYRIYLGY